MDSSNAPIETLLAARLALRKSERHVAVPAPADPSPETTHNRESLQNQIRHLNHQLETAMLEKNAARDGIDKVLKDLVHAQLDLEQQRQSAAHKDVRIAQLSDDKASLSRRVEEQGQRLADLTARSLQREPASATKIQEIRDLQQKSDQMLAMATKDQAIKSLLSRSARDLRLHVDGLEKKWDDERYGRLDAEAKVQQLAHELQKREAADDATKLRRQLDFYKANAESASRRGTDALAVNRQLEAKVAELTKQLTYEHSAKGIILVDTQNQGIKSG